MANEMNKKTGATPLPEGDALGKGKVLGVLPVDTALIKFKDGRDGKEQVRLAVVIPGGEVYFFSDKALDLRPAQSWMKDEVRRKIGERKGTAPSMPVATGDLGSGEGMTSVDLTESKDIPITNLNGNQV